MSMKILYGVQGTGNGHLARARLLAKEFTRRGVTVDYLFSGRESKHFFELEDFGDAQFRRGLTLATRDSRIDRLRTVTNNNVFQFAVDVRNLRPQRYDLVVTDYEPLAAWSSRFRRVCSLGLGHQYAFNQSEAPRPKGNWPAKLLLNQFAPVDYGIGLHWARYAPDVLPPIVNTRLRRRQNTQSPFTLVYRPFDDLVKLTSVLKRITDRRFEIYSPEVKKAYCKGHLSYNPVSYHRFKSHLISCENIICSGGFELISEALHLGIPVLAQAVPGQFEQEANILSLKQLGLASCLEHLSVEGVVKFLDRQKVASVQCYPNVAQYLAEFIVGQQFYDRPALKRLSKELWSRVDSSYEEHSPAAMPLARYA